ncbi:hypothetical protein SLS55_010231 [Diplodia seriata]|uniref:Uncharacterized protein n=1 Tax=Diplodia seriata TaxID=420778 RepID=A0ABR3BXX9_9PEZI
MVNNTFTPPPRAVVTGGGYSDDAFSDLFNACVAACGGKESDLPVPFFRVDNTITERLAKEGSGPPLPDIGGKVPGVVEREGYAKAIAGRLKERIRGVEEGGEGKEGGKVFAF